MAGICCWRHTTPSSGSKSALPFDLAVILPLIFALIAAGEERQV